MNYIGGIMRIKKESINLVILLLIAVLLIAFSAEAKNGALHGISMATEVVVPGLLPLLIIFNLISKSDIGRASCRERVYLTV